MPTYKHFQEVQKAVRLPDRDKVGACLTCRYWKVEGRRPESLTRRLALCIQPNLKPFALIVSGSSACTQWVEKRGVGPKAKGYAERGAGD